MEETERLNMFANRIQMPPPPNVKIAGGRESGARWHLTFVFSSKGATAFDRKETIENVSEVRHGG